jgi:FKBP-type peptidyl-prolyl cis-trans isomerase
VSVRYTGTLTDGTKFDSSYDHNPPDPIQFPIGTPNIIQGWNEGITGMKVGGKRHLVIPPGLAYGAAGRPPVIPPNATLVFDVELVDVH